MTIIGNRINTALARFERIKARRRYYDKDGEPIISKAEQEALDVLPGYGYCLEKDWIRTLGRVPKLKELRRLVSVLEKVTK